MKKAKPKAAVKPAKKAMPMNTLKKSGKKPMGIDVSQLDFPSTKKKKKGY